MTRSTINAEFLAGLPSPLEEDLSDSIQELVEGGRHKVVVIDDDSVGTQNLGKASVVCSWDEADIDWLLHQPGVGFISTGARWHEPDRAIEIAAAVGASLRTVSKRQNVFLTVVFHDASPDPGVVAVPPAMAALTTALGDCSRGSLVVPTCLDRGESTITVHGSVYKQQGTTFEATPQNQELPCIDIELLRTGGSDRVAQHLGRFADGSLCVVDAVTRNDLQIIAASILKASASGSPWTIRSEQSLVPALVGESPRRIGKPPRMSPDIGGMVLVGPEATLTASLRDALADLTHVELVPARLEMLQDVRTSRNEVFDIARISSEHIRNGKTAVVYLEDEVVGAEMNADDLARVTMRLCSTVLAVADQPAYLIIQAGGTAHVLAVDVINARRSSVLGPVMSKLAMWRTGGASAVPDAPFLALPYYPNRRDLAEAVWLLEERRVS